MARCPTCLECAVLAGGRCRACGEPLSPPCPACGREREPGRRACAGCGEGLPEAEPESGLDPGAESARGVGALAHPREVAAFAGLLEQVSLRTPRARPRERPAPETGPVIPVPAGPARDLADELGVSPGLRRVARGGVQLRGDQLEVGRNLAATLDGPELAFLALAELYPRRIGLEPGATLQGNGPARTAWARYLPLLALSADRFAWVHSGLPLPQAARARFKAAALGGPRPLSGVLERLRGFLPGEDFRAYRELFEPLPGELERIWELVAFARSRAGQAWQARVQEDRRAKGGAPQGAVPPPAKEPLPEQAAAPPPPVRRGNLRMLRPAGQHSSPLAGGPLAQEWPLGGPGAAVLALAGSGAAQIRPELDGVGHPAAGHPAEPGILVLSAYHGELRFAAGGEVHRLDLREHLRMPTRLAASRTGDLWVADGETGRLLRLDPQGRPVARLDGGPRRPGPMEVDERGQLWVADSQAGRIRLLDAQGRELREFGGAVSPGLTSIGGLARDGAGGLWVSDPRGRRLVWLDPEGAPRRVFQTTRMSGGVERPGALVGDGEGGVWVVDEASGRVLRIGPAGVVREVRAPDAATSLLGARLKLGPGGGLLLLDGPRARLVGWDEAGRPVDALPDLVAPEDRHGYAADLEVGGRLGVPSAGLEGGAAPAALAPTGTWGCPSGSPHRPGGHPCVPSTSSSRRRPGASSPRRRSTS